MRRTNAGAIMKRLKGVFPLAIGSFPHVAAEAALDLIFEAFPDIPIWPQLPKSRFLENMYVQYSHPVPGVRLDEEKQRIFVDTETRIERELERFYTHVLEEDLDYFKLPETYAAGFYALLERLKRAENAPLRALKGHVTGPFSFGLTVPDQNGRAIFYHSEIYEAVVTALSLNARWQVQQLKRYASEVIVFIDEPYLVSFGSAFVAANRENVISSLNQVVESIHQEGAVAGIHCCGNTDWSLVLHSDLDVLSFDAFRFFPNLLLYLNDLTHFFRRGGSIAWGIVPSSDEVFEQSARALTELLSSYLAELESKGMEGEWLTGCAFVTPACGVGSETEAVAEEAVRKTQIVAREILS
ncbi:MAG: hypothetical protein HY788_23365 [Deltaproteobacteria bacterium]|nr:hypothetical protein [Deltaproteobacteria bacterium]